MPAAPPVLGLAEAPEALLLAGVTGLEDSPPQAAKPKAPEPPFNVVGLELRGGERFVSIASRGATSLTDLRLLREGESIGAWQLQTIDAHAVVFLVDDQTVRVALP